MSRTTTTTTTTTTAAKATTMLTLQHPQMPPHPTRAMSSTSSSHLSHHHNHRPAASSSTSSRQLSPPRRLPAAAPRSASSASTSTASKPPIDISTYPSVDLLRALAGLLQRVATTNDALRSHQQHASHASLSAPSGSNVPLYTSLTTASKQSLLTHSSPLSFHARNVPAISIESYLLRILKYCPTTNEVFLSLLIYFDRMASLGDAIRREILISSGALAPDDPPPPSGNGGGLVIDSYNVHRLIIAGVTVASKFFSDVFYTNSRYAKVGGLPQSELNQLELQFLLLNDFRLVIPLEELQSYAEQLLLFSASTNTTPRPSSSLSATPSSTLSSSSSVTLYPIIATPNGYSSAYRHSSASTSHTPSSSIDKTLPDTSSDRILAHQDRSIGDPPPVPTPASSTSTITPSSYANDVPTPSATLTPSSTTDVEADGDSYAASEDDPTIRVNHQLVGSISSHSQRSSFSRTNSGEDDDAEAPIPDRENSPAASLRYVNGAWNRGGDVIGRPYIESDTDEDDDSQDGDPRRGGDPDDEGYDHPETEDEVVYRGRVKGLGPSLFGSGFVKMTSTPTLGSTNA